jgi:hypothetical protein
MKIKITKSNLQRSKKKNLKKYQTVGKVSNDQSGKKHKGHRFIAEFCLTPKELILVLF